MAEWPVKQLILVKDRSVLHQSELGRNLNEGKKKREETWKRGKEVKKKWLKQKTETPHGVSDKGKSTWHSYTGRKTRARMKLHE